MRPFAPCFASAEDGQPVYVLRRGRRPMAVTVWRWSAKHDCCRRMEATKEVIRAQDSPPQVVCHCPVASKIVGGLVAKSIDPYASFEIASASNPRAETLLRITGSSFRYQPRVPKVILRGGTLPPRINGSRDLP